MTKWNIIENREQISSKYLLKRAKLAESTGYETQKKWKNNSTAPFAKQWRKTRRIWSLSWENLIRKLGRTTLGINELWKNTEDIQNISGAAENENPIGALLIGFTLLYENIYLLSVVYTVKNDHFKKLVGAECLPLPNHFLPPNLHLTLEKYLNFITAYIIINENISSFTVNTNTCTNYFNTYWKCCLDGSISPPTLPLHLFVMSPGFSLWV